MAVLRALQMHPTGKMAICSDSEFVLLRTYEPVQMGRQGWGKARGKMGLFLPATPPQPSW